MANPPERLRACDVLNWDCLCRIAVKLDADTATLSEAMADFAYRFTSTADDNVRDEMLQTFLENATDGQSKETVEKLVEVLAERLETDHQKLRQFGKQCKIRLKRG